MEPNEGGYLSVFERAAGAWREISSTRVRGTLAFDPSGAIDLFVVLSREARQTQYPVPEARLDQVMSVNLQERLTYVVLRRAWRRGMVAFPITLSHK